MVDIDALLEEGAQTIAMSRRVLSDADHLEGATRELILTYELFLTRAHHLRSISGASDTGVASIATLRQVLPISGGMDEAKKTAERLQELMTSGAVALLSGPSSGATCDACGRTIAPDGTEYLASASGHDMRLDRECLGVLMKQLTTRVSKRR